MNARVKDRRRGEFRERFPTHFCSTCRAVLYPEDDQCGECEAFRPTAGWSEVSQGSDPLLGRVLAGRYLLTKRLGQGSHAKVYRATSLQIAREFAVKLVNLGEGSKRVRFDKEVEALSALRNPHFVTLFEVLELYNDYSALVMQLAEGRRLDHLVQAEGPLEPHRALKIVRQLADGISEAHSCRLVHRDLKPENVMVERMPCGDDFVRVLDFGIVYMAGDPRKTAGFLGSPLYASPEQISGGRIDSRSDIYSLGAILYFLLAGEPPFAGQTVDEVLRAHTTTPIRTWQVADRVGPEGVRLLVDVLAKDPNERPMTAQQLVERIDLVLRDLPGTALQEDSSAQLRETPISGVRPVRVRHTTNIPLRSRAAHEEFLVMPYSMPVRGLDVCGEYTYVMGMDGGIVANHVGCMARVDEVAHASAVAGSCDGEYLAVGTDLGDVHIYRDGKPWRTLQHATRAEIRAVAVTCRGEVFAGMQSGMVLRAGVEDDKLVPLAFGSPVSALAVSSDCTQIAVARDTGLVEIRGIPVADVVSSWALRTPARAIAFSGDGYLVATLGEDQIVSLHQVLMGRSIIAFDPGRDFLSVRFDRENQLIGYQTSELGVHGVRLHGMRTA